MSVNHDKVQPEFIKGDPPTEGQNPRSVYDRIRSILRANPGKWAKLHRFPKSERPTARNVRVALLYKQPDLEAVMRVVGEEIVLYARAKEQA